MNAVLVVLALCLALASAFSPAGGMARWEFTGRRAKRHINLPYLFFPHPSLLPLPPRRRLSRCNMEMKESGKVKFFDATKGFGFITPASGGEDIFVHQTAVYAQGFRSLAEGEDVEFDISEDKAKGKKFASNVTGPNGAYVQGAPRKERSMGGGSYGESA